MTLKIPYVAGLLDGEGSILISSFIRKRGNKKYRTYREYIKIYNSHLGILTLIQEQFGGCVGMYHKSKKLTNIKSMYTWQITGMTAVKFIKRIRPYLVIKAAQADVYLAFREEIERAKMGRGFIRLCSSDIARRRNLFLKMKSINKRGL